MGGSITRHGYQLVAAAGHGPHLDPGLEISTDGPWISREPTPQSLRFDARPVGDALAAGLAGRLVRWPDRG